jgi:hypothetical protein
MKGISPEGGLCFKLGMWTEQTDGRMAKIAKKTKRYPSDLTEEWERIAPLMPRALARGRRRTVEFREVIGSVSGPFGVWLADAADPLWAVADDLLLVPAPGAKVSVSDHPRPGIDARS